MVSEQKWCLNLQADIHHRPSLSPGKHWTFQESLPPYCLWWFTPWKLNRLCSWHCPSPHYDVYLACRWANWKRHHALSFHHFVILRKSRERQGNHFKYPPSALSPEKKKTKQKHFLWFGYMDSIYWPSSPCELCHLGDNDLHFLESAVYNDCKDTRAEWKGKHFKGT